jgi:hypothetical protein
MTPPLSHLRVVLLCALAACAGAKDDDDDDGGSYPTLDGADGGSDGADGAGDGADGTVDACDGSTPILLDDGRASGFERCDDGSVHRVSVEDAPVTVDADRCRGDEVELSCVEDADCTGSSNGACVTQFPAWAEYDSCSCVYACGSDIDCDAGEICLPTDIVEGDTAWSTCVAAACTTDADCGSGECGVESWYDGCGYVTGAVCRDPDLDTCRSDADCSGYEDDCGTSWGATAPYACHGEDCAIGRPLLVESAPRTAPLVARDDWVAEAPPHIDAPQAVRRRLAARWAAIAALEHASVASFARFTLQLMALGAPADLLADTQRAAADEVEHARLAYALAAAAGGAPVGPGPLDLSGAAPAFDPAGVMRGLVDEACVGETLGAAEAAEAARRCHDPAVRAVLTRIADDETRHAALAWRSLSWLLDAHPHLREEARARLLDAAATLGGADLGPDQGLAAHGLLSGPALTALRQETIRAVVAPCVAALA